MLKITEIFDSIQGEGILVGTPSTFIRLAGCNNRCKWCDTKYSSYKVKKFVEVSERNILYLCNEHYIVITGGEPLLQNISRLCKKIKAKGHHITIETNGTIFKKLDCNLISISPKFGSSGHRPNIKVLNKLIDYYKPNLQLKFVVKNKDDIFQVSEILSYLNINFKVPIILQPEGSGSIDNYKRRIDRIYNIVSMNSNLFNKYNLRIIPQMHKLIGMK